MIKIIAVTANANPEEQDKCLEAGMDDYLIKPIKIEKLSHVLGEIANAVGAEQGVADNSDAESIVQGLKSFGEAEVIIELINLFLEDAPKKIVEAKKAVNSRDYKAIREAAHSLKGSARNLRAGGLAESCEILEQSAKKEFEIATANYNLGRVEDEFKKVIVILNNQKNI